MSSIGRPTKRIKCRYCGNIYPTSSRMSTCVKCKSTNDLEDPDVEIVS